MYTYTQRPCGCFTLNQNLQADGRLGDEECFYFVFVFVICLFLEHFSIFKYLLG